jgi:hypothetical protein
MRPARYLVPVAILLAPAAGQTTETVIPDALYRPGTPPVLQPAEADVLLRREGIVQAFARVYQTQGRPRVALFLNRRFDDRVTEWTSGPRITETESTRFHGSLSGERREASGAAGSINGTLGTDLNRRRSIQAEWRDPQAVRPGLEEALAFELETGFAAPLTEADVIVLDRAAIMRLQDRAQRSSEPDAQRLETDALLGRADLLIEILMSPHPSAPLDMTFQIMIKEVRTGRIVASVTEDGHSASQRAGGRWEVGTRGFVPASSKRLEVARRVGEQLALETMDALVERWR